MTKWPKEWRSCFAGVTIKTPNGTDLTVDVSGAIDVVLESLHKAGALKTPPKPREWWVLMDHDDFDIVSIVSQPNEHLAKVLAKDGNKTLIRVREVLEEE